MPRQPSSPESSFSSKSRNSRSHAESCGQPHCSCRSQGEVGQPPPPSAGRAPPSAIGGGDGERPPSTRSSWPPGSAADAQDSAAVSAAVRSGESQMLWILNEHLDASGAREDITPGPEPIRRRSHPRRGRSRAPAGGYSSSWSVGIADGRSPRSAPESSEVVLRSLSAMTCKNAQSTFTDSAGSFLITS